MLKTIYLVHHSHTDIGYTHPQPMLRYLQQRFLDEAIALTESTSDYPAGSRAKWTCETLLPLLDWLETSTDREIERFLALERRGLIEVTGSYAIMTQCTPPRAWDFILGKIEDLRTTFGLTIRSAMLSDINGAPWVLPDLLSAHGIGNFSMAINEHFGKSCLPRSYPFIWQGPQGGLLRVWNNFHYNSNQYFGIPYDMDFAVREISKLQTWLDERGNKLEFTLFQVTRPDFCDNNGVDARLPDFVREWNTRDHLPRLEIVTLSGFFDAVGSRAFQDAPMHTGEWTDFWNFGAASTPHETRINRRTYRTLRDVEALTGQLPADQTKDISEMIIHSLKNAVLYNEHTWGADVSVSDCFCDSSRAGLHYKQNFAHEADTFSKIARAEIMARLASRTKTNSPGTGMLLINSLPRTRKQAIEIPVAWLRRDVVPTRSHQHRMQMLPVMWPAETVPMPCEPTPTRYADAHSVRLEIELGPYAQTFLSASQIYERGKPVVTREIAPLSHSISNKHFEVQISPQGGISSIREHSSGREWVSSSPLSPVGLPVRESPTLGHRKAIRPWPDYTRFMTFEGFSTDWKADYSISQPSLPPRVFHNGECVTLQQDLANPFANSARLSITLDDSTPWVDLRVDVDFRWDERPCAWYLPLEFALCTPSFDYDNCGVSVRLGRDQLPNANMDFVTVDRWISVSDSNSSAVVVPLDTPIFSCGGFTFGRLTNQESSRRPMLAAWLHSNYWDTNFAASCLGKVTFRFLILPRAGNLDTNSANQLFEDVAHPFLIQPVTNPPA